MHGINIVSGAASPLGISYCNHLINQGEKCIAIVNNNNPFIDSDIEVWQADLSTESGIQKVCSKINNRKVWSFIHLAANSDKDNLDIIEMQRVFTVNVFSAWIIAEHLIKNMTHGGRIVFAGSVGHKFGGKYNNIAYSASKYTIEYYPKIFQECAQNNILVNTVRFGVMNGGTQDKMKTNMEKRINLIPTKKAVSHLEAVRTISFLCSKDNQSIHNSTLPCTGGE